MSYDDWKLASPDDELDHTAEAEAREERLAEEADRTETDWREW